MNNCSHKNYQFKYFLSPQEYIYSGEDPLGYGYCIFHAPEHLKESFNRFQDMEFQNSIKKYMNECISKGTMIDFSDVIFHLPFIENNLNTSSFYFNFTTKNKIICEKALDIDFTNATFLKSFRMDNLKCATLTFQDTKFHKGGGLKNKDINGKIYIENLIFRPYQLDSDFVIDIGKYANKEGLIEAKYGVIKKMRFENHKEGNARIYFIGLNNNIEEANFRNMILDNVSFQNCDLSKCYFLNAKIDETEFRNCEFDRNHDAHNTWIYFAIFSVIFFLIFFILTNGEYIGIGLSYIFSISSLFIGLNLHKSIFDEKGLSTKHGEKEEETWFSISETYSVLKDNFSKTNYQSGGDFFYSQRLIERRYSKNIYDKVLYTLHYIINGFGEKFFRPFFMFFALIFLFSGYYHPNRDFIATDVTPIFLLESNISSENYKIQYFETNREENKSTIFRKYKSVNLKDNYQIRLIYSTSQFISPFIPKNKAWFKVNSDQAMYLTLVESILLFLFFGAFILAVKNRIKR